MFAVEAAAFQRWACSGGDEGELAAREALLRITRLYSAALVLPPAWNEAVTDGCRARVDDDEWKAIVAAAARLPLDYYGEVYNPLTVPPDEAAVGSLADDIADIYRDVVTGLREYEAGRPVEALWQWGFLFGAHWGEHATGAIRALHAWLSANARDHLAQVPRVLRNDDGGKPG
jgi:hypothetical protein